MLDLARISRQVGEATRSESERQGRCREQTEHAAALLRAFDAERWSAQVARIRDARTPWQMAHTAELPAIGTAVGEAPARYLVVAVDGSQIAPDRHEGVGGCYLLSASQIVLSYGEGRRARLDAVAEVRTLDENDEEDETRAEAALSARRYAYEMKTIGDLLCETAWANADTPTIALTDGSLIAWHLYDKSERDPIKQEALAALKATLAQARECGVPLVGYLSDSRARDVVSALRVVLCPEETVACHRCSGSFAPENERPCRALSQTTDSDLFAALLAPGERSPVFTSRTQAAGYSKILEQYPNEDKIDFFYLNVGREIARVEIPAWVADDPGRVALVQSICYDQACKGGSYPVALAEAHERAVLRGADREAFLNLVRREFVRAQMPVTVTRKALAKRTRAV